MALLQLNGISKAYGAKVIFENISLQLEAGDHIGIVGANGAGKTTLIRCLIGEEIPDTGEIFRADGIRIGYLQQTTDWSASGSIWDELMDVFSDVIYQKECMDKLADEMSNLNNDHLDEIMKEYSCCVERFERADGYNIEFNVRRVARGLGFRETDEGRLVVTLSGGEKTRLSLARLLLRKPDILLLDEPTNHLDIEMVEWLEGFLREYSGGMAVISHDRYFLDRVTNKTFAMEQGRGTLYPGNYSRFMYLQEEQQEAEQRAYQKQQQWIEKTEAFVDKYRAGIKSKQARGRQSQLSRLDRLSKPGETQALSDIIFEPAMLSGEKVLHLTDINQNFGDRTVLTGITISIRRGEGVALIGPNGAGKTTLLKLITGALKPASGQVRIGSKVKIGYFSQHHENITASNSVLAEIVNEYGFTENVARKYLAVFLFHGDDVFKRIGELSGGEKARIVMLKLLLSGSNFLVLDEPTNHLDIPSKEAFEKALQNYTGTFLVVSHDRYFLDQTVNRVLEIEQGKICDYVGDYTYYQIKKRERYITQSNIKQVTETTKQLKAPTKEKQKTNYAKSIAQMEKEIAAVEEEIKKVEQLLNDERICANYEKMNELSNTYTALTLSLNEKMGQWEILMQTSEKDKCR